MSSEVTVVLVHGAWADGSSWERVIGGLWSAGVKVVAAPLPLTSLEEDVAALEGVIERAGDPVVLVAHAYAGGVVGSVRDRGDDVTALVYVAALAPDEGETLAEVFGRVAPHPDAPALVPDRRGLIWLPGEAFPAVFAQQASAEEQALLCAVQRPISPACITVPVGRPLWRDRPSWFLVAEEDRMIAPETQLFMAGRMGAAVRAHPVDHMPLVTAPSVVTGLILEVVKSVSREP